ncbi:hypothetical protein ACQ4M3_41125 [Leptolyngbya sp. AN03gr2]
MLETILIAIGLCSFYKLTHDYLVKQALQDTSEPTRHASTVYPHDFDL